MDLGQEYILMCPIGKESPSKRQACEFESHHQDQYIITKRLFLIINYSSKISAGAVLIGDSEIEDYLLTSVNLSTTININQISIIYVLRKLIAQKKINPNHVVVYIDEVVHTFNETGRFNNYNPFVDLFDESLDAILNSTNKVKL